MRIQPEQTIAGQPATLVRKLLKRGADRDWEAGLAEAVLRIPADQANGVLADLADLGFVQPASGPRPSGSWWSNTLQGNALANATAAKPIRRSTADRVLRELLVRVEEVNSDPYYLYRVRYVVVFGSYLSKSLTMNDVDLAIEIQSRESDPERWKVRHQDRVARALQAGRSFSNIVEQLAWPRTEVWLKLKSRSRTLSLHDLEGEAPMIKEGRFLVLFADDGVDPIPASLRG